MLNATVSALMSWGIFKPSVNHKIPPTIDFADTLAQVVIELLPSLTATQGQQLLTAGINYLQPSSAYSAQIDSLEQKRQAIETICNEPIIPAIERTAFRQHANEIERWINQQFSDNQPLCIDFLMAFAELSAHRRYANATPHMSLICVGES